MDYGSVIQTGRADNINQSGLIIDMEARTARLDPDSYWLEVLTRKLGKGKIATKRMKHEFRERRLIPNWTTVASSSSGTTLNVNAAHYSYIKNDHLLYLPDYDDLLRVTATPTTGAVAVVDATDGSSNMPNTAAAGSEVIILNGGDAHAEGDDPPTAYTNLSVNREDYVMQMDRTIEVTDIEEAISHYDSSEKRAADRRQAWIEFMRAKNFLFYVGQNARETSDTARRHVCGGLIEKLTENDNDFSAGGAGFTLSVLGDVMADTKFHSSSSNIKIGIMGTAAWSAISGWPVSYLRVSPNEKKWGIRVNRLITGYGDMDVGYDPVLSASYGLEDRVFVVDPKWLRQLYLQGLPTRMHLEITESSTTHKKVDLITGTFGLQRKFDELHAQGSGVGT